MHARKKSSCPKPPTKNKRNQCQQNAHSVVAGNGANIEYGGEGRPVKLNMEWGRPANRYCMFTSRQGRIGRTASLSAGAVQCNLKVFFRESWGDIHLETICRYVTVCIDADFYVEVYVNVDIHGFVFQLRFPASLPDSISQLSLPAPGFAACLSRVSRCCERRLLAGTLSQRHCFDMAVKRRSPYRQKASYRCLPPQPTGPYFGRAGPR